VRNIDEEQWSQGEHECWSISVAIKVGVSINYKGGYCWILGLDGLYSLFSLISTLRY
jgi:hypothetical protein